MKKLQLILLIFAPILSFSQSEEKKIEVTLKSDKVERVDYSKIAKDFVSSMNRIVAEREEKKAQLEKITKFTKTEIVTNTSLGYSTDLNDLILKTQKESIETVEMYHRVLTKGLTNPDDYESSLTTLTTNYFNCMSIFQNIDKYLQRKIDSYLANNETTKFNQLNTAIKAAISKTTANYWSESSQRGRYSYEYNQRFLFYLNGDFNKKDEKLEINQLYTYIIQKINEVE